MAGKPAAPKKRKGRTTKNSLRALRRSREDRRLYWKSRPVRKEYVRRKRRVYKSKHPRIIYWLNPERIIPFSGCRNKKKMQLRCISSRDSGVEEWESHYECDESHKTCIHREKKFKTANEAFADFRRGLKMAKSLSCVEIHLEPNLKYIPTFGRKWAPDSKLCLEYIGDDDGASDAFKSVLSHIDKSLKVNVKLSWKDSSRLVIEDFLKMEQDYNFTFSSLSCGLSEAQFFGLRGNRFCMQNSEAITPNGFVKLIQKVLKSNSSDKYKYSFYEPSSEFKSWLFDGGKKYNQGKLYLNMCFLKNAELLVFFSSNTIKVETFIGGNCYSSSINAETLKEYPKLRKFLAHVSEGLPPKFKLLDEQ